MSLLRLKPRSARRTAIVVLLAVSAMFACASTAFAQAANQRTADGIIISASDANELAQSLADSTSSQGICYGWRANVSDDSGGPSGVDEGSGQDPNSAAPAQRCSKYVILQADITYTCNSCEANDSASYSILTNLPNAPTSQDFQQLGVAKTSDLLGNNDDTALINTVEAMPLIMSEKGAARAIPADLSAKPSATDHPTGSGSDTPHVSPGLIVLGGLLFLGGLTWVGVELANRNRPRPLGAPAMATAGPSDVPPPSEEPPPSAPKS
jgi:hypothetical protein